MDSIKLILRDYNNINELSDQELEKLICEMIDIEEVPSALRELDKRDSKLSLILSKNILKNSLGDEYLQAAVVEFIFDRDNQYMVKFTEDRIETMNYYVFGCILDCLSVEAMQPFGRGLSKHFLQSLVNRYNIYDEDKKAKIKDKFKWFLDSYEKMI